MSPDTLTEALCDHYISLNSHLLGTYNRMALLGGLFLQGISALA